jgi:hypothetical protein
MRREQQLIMSLNVLGVHAVATELPSSPTNRRGTASAANWRASTRRLQRADRLARPAPSVSRAGSRTSVVDVSVELEDYDGFEAQRVALQSVADGLSSRRSKHEERASLLAATRNAFRQQLPDARSERGSKDSKPRTAPTTPKTTLKEPYRPSGTLPAVPAGPDDPP